MGALVFLALIEMEILVGYNGFFSCTKRATNGSSFWGVEKTIFSPQDCNGEMD
jgi:hypothetical protein